MNSLCHRHTWGKGPGRPRILLQRVCACVEAHVLGGTVADLGGLHVDTEEFCLYEREVFLVPLSFQDYLIHQDRFIE